MSAEDEPSAGQSLVIDNVGSLITNDPALGRRAPRDHSERERRHRR